MSSRIEFIPSCRVMCDNGAEIVILTTAGKTMFNDRRGRTLVNCCSRHIERPIGRREQD